MFGRAIYDIIKYRPVETIKTMREKKGGGFYELL